MNGRERGRRKGGGHGQRLRDDVLVTLIGSLVYFLMLKDWFKLRIREGMDRNSKRYEYMRILGVF